MKDIASLNHLTSLRQKRKLHRRQNNCQLNSQTGEAKRGLTILSHWANIVVFLYAAMMGIYQKIHYHEDIISVGYKVRYYSRMYYFCNCSVIQLLSSRCQLTKYQCKLLLQYGGSCVLHSYFGGHPPLASQPWICHVLACSQ